MGLRVWSRGEFFSKNMNKNLGRLDPPPIKTIIKYQLKNKNNIFDLWVVGTVKQSNGSKFPRHQNKIKEYFGKGLTVHSINAGDYVDDTVPATSVTPADFGGGGVDAGNEVILAINDDGVIETAPKQTDITIR